MGRATLPASLRLCRNYLYFVENRGLLKSRITKFFKNLRVKPLPKKKFFSFFSNCDTVSSLPESVPASRQPFGYDVFLAAEYNETEVAVWENVCFLSDGIL